MVEPLVHRLGGLDRPAKLVLTARTPPEGMDWIEPTGTAFIQELREDEAVIEIEADASRFHAIIAKRRPDWTEPPIDRIMSWTGGDLAILHIILDAVDRQDLDNAATLEGLFPKIRQLIFGSNRARAPNLRHLAAVAQFDIAVPEELFPEPFEAERNKVAVDRFVIAGGEPSRLAFRHPSAAELLFQLLAWANAEADAEAACARDCAEVLASCAARRGATSVVNDMLPGLLHARLNLADGGAIKRALLADPRIEALTAGPDVPSKTLSLAAFLCRDAVPVYAARLAARLEALLAGPTEQEIQLLGLFLRSLQLADPIEYAELERRIGAQRMIEAIAAKGTLPALFGVLQQCTPRFAELLLRAVAEEQLKTLATRTVAREASIGTFNLALRELAKRDLAHGSGRTQLQLFEEKLGVAACWRLIRRVGRLNHLAYLLDGLTPRFRARLLSPDAALDCEGWSGLARRGSLYDAARFAADGLPGLPTATAQRFRAAVAETAAEITTNSTWGNIGSALAKLEKVADEHVRATLTEAAFTRIEAVDVAHLAFDDYEEAVEALSVLWRNRPALRPELGAALWRLVPRENRWPDSYKLLIQARFLCTIARSEHVGEADALRVLKAFSPISSRVTLDPKSARHHALFLWNLFALWYERGSAVTAEFRDLQDERTWQRFVAVVEKRQGWRGNNDKLDTLMLAGALAFLVPELRPRLVERVRGKIVGIQHLQTMADRDLSCIPAFLAFHGMALSAPPHRIFTREKVGSLHEKAKAYEERGPALIHLLATLNNPRASGPQRQAGPKSGRGPRRLGR